MADQGTLFLDEIGELPLSAQKIFLRVLQEKRFRPVQRDLAEGFGIACLWTLILIYGRSILKIILKNGPLLQRFIPNTEYERSLSISRKILRFLNQTHKYVGSVAVLIFMTHALLMGIIHWNLFLKMVLFLLVWQGLFGLFLVFRFKAKSLQKYSYLVHAQLFTGIMIALFAGFGHLLVQ